MPEQEKRELRMSLRMKKRRRKVKEGEERIEDNSALLITLSSIGFPLSRHASKDDRR